MQSSKKEGSSGKQKRGKIFWKKYINLTEEEEKIKHKVGNLAMFGCEEGLTWNSVNQI